MFHLNGDDIPLDVKSLKISYFTYDTPVDDFYIAYNKTFHVYHSSPEGVCMGYGKHETEFYLEDFNDVLDLINSTTQLKKLNIQFLLINDVQERFFNLKYLKTLILWKTSLSVLSPNICMLSTLKRLDLSKNKLSMLPDSIGNLHNLIHLNLRGNELILLPESICGLKDLKTLDVGKNKLTSLPERITCLTKLKKLLARNNQLTRLPLCIGTMQNLKVISIEGNKITTLPESIAYNKKLRYLQENHSHRPKAESDKSCCCIRNKLAKKASRISYYNAKKRVFIRTYFVLALKCPASVTTAVMHFTGLDVIEKRTVYNYFI
jgi:hypothetical protein